MKPHDEILLEKCWWNDDEMLNEGIQKGWIELVNRKCDLVERMNFRISLQNRGLKISIDMIDHKGLRRSEWRSKTRKIKL